MKQKIAVIVVTGSSLLVGIACAFSGKSDIYKHVQSSKRSCCRQKIRNKPDLFVTSFCWDVSRFAAYSSHCKTKKRKSSEKKMEEIFSKITKNNNNESVGVIRKK
ncbi:hypothetical protein [Parageobacillus thermoglucosidasius]|uniref:Lipoprotein n=1 Tax=Parageobacillus thermoglucosidasius TaxID=1426 RepID=A0AB38QWI2_PARTM|nr:hypothetical protein [Parageobacillus thermoglucosidasius]UOE74832.1 hypothetical protein IMI45_10645 [Parageobacillus thermoglucosidasius]